MVQQCVRKKKAWLWTHWKLVVKASESYLWDTVERPLHAPLAGITESRTFIHLADALGIMSQSALHMRTLQLLLCKTVLGGKGIRWNGPSVWVLTLPPLPCWYKAFGTKSTFTSHLCICLKFANTFIAHHRAIAMSCPRALWHISGEARSRTTDE